MTSAASAVDEDAAVVNGKDVDEVAVDVEHGGGDWNGAMELSLFEDKPLSIVEADSQLEHSVRVISIDCSAKYASNN